MSPGTDCFVAKRSLLRRAQSPFPHATRPRKMFLSEFDFLTIVIATDGSEVVSIKPSG
jgi:hypothetical protein